MLPGARLRSIEVMATHSPAAIVPKTIVDVLLPNSSDQFLDELANAIFLDEEVAVPVSPVDQLLMAFVRRLVMDRSLGGTAVVQLPRAKHRSALVLAITSHLLCRRPPVRFGGPVVLIAFDVDLASQLRTLGVQHYRRMGLAAGNPLSAHRLTRLGDIVPVIGTEARPVDSSLVYFNTRVGRPDLACNAPLVILDATSVVHPAARTRALEWALDRGAAATVAVGDIGDEGLIETMTSCGSVPTVLAVTESIGDELVATFNRGQPPPSTLSSMSVLTERRTEVVLHRVPGDEVNEAVTKALGALAGKPEGPMPPELDLPLNLLRNGTRLARARTRLQDRVHQQHSTRRDAAYPPARPSGPPAAELEDLGDYKARGASNRGEGALEGDRGDQPEATPRSGARSTRSSEPKAGPSRSAVIRGPQPRRRSRRSLAGSARRPKSSSGSGSLLGRR